MNGNTYDVVVIVARAKAEAVEDGRWGRRVATAEAVEDGRWGRCVATADEHAVPQVVFTDPEIASVGLTAAAAGREARPHITTHHLPVLRTPRPRHEAGAG